MVGVSVLSFLTALNTSNRQSIALKQELAREHLDTVLDKSMDSSLCACHFDSSRDSSLTLNTVDLSDIELDNIRTGCDFSSMDNILIAENMDIGGGVQIDKIKVTGLALRGGIRYEGNLTVSYSVSGGMRALRTSGNSHGAFS